MRDDQAAIIGEGHFRFIKHNFYFRSQRGSHRKYSDGRHNVIVPTAKKEISLGTIKSISKQSGLDYDMFINL